MLPAFSSPRQSRHLDYSRGGVCVCFMRGKRCTRSAPSFECAFRGREDAGAGRRTGRWCRRVNCMRNRILLYTPTPSQGQCLCGRCGGKRRALQKKNKYRRLNLSARLRPHPASLCSMKYIVVLLGYSIICCAGGGGDRDSAHVSGP